MEEKKKKKKNLDVSKFIELEPKINEAKNSTVVLTFGRFSPPTTGHEKLANKLVAEARSRRATPMIFTSHTFDKKKNPLSYDSKITYMKKAFGSIVQKSTARTIIEVAKELSSRFENLVVVVGSDRVTEFQTLLSKYNGKEYKYDMIEVVSAGARDPDADDVSGMSASKLRSLVTEGNFEEFKKGLPTRLRRDADKMYDELRTNMGLSEDLVVEEESLDERAPLTVQQRRQRGRTMRRYKAKIAVARKRAARRKASPEKLKVRARKKAREIIRQRFLQGKKYGDLSPSQKVQVDQRLHRIPDAVISRIATRQLPQVRKGEMERLARVRGGVKTESLDHQFETFLSEKKDVESHPYHKGLAPSTADKRKSHFKKGAEKDPGDPSAYEPAPGDARAETKPSSHTKRYHQLFTKEGTVKHDRRFKFYRKKDNPYFKEDVDAINENEASLRKKAQETGISYGILKKVFDRGVAAWRTGHRPGTTPTQWGLARVNSFATGGKTQKTTDADLWSQHKGKKESFIDDAYSLMEEVESFIAEQTALQRAQEQIRREKETAKQRHDRLRDAARRTDQAQRNESKLEKDDPHNREEGTDSLVAIYKKDTPGQKDESYFSSDIPSSFGDFRRGSKVRFNSHSLDMADGNETKEGTVVGTNVQHLRVRDESGTLYNVRHADAELIESSSDLTFDQLFEYSFLGKDKQK
jgi:nicotinamide mononucleotide adenylyltransferase